jgi:hypothetical protein
MNKMKKFAVGLMSLAFAAFIGVQSTFAAAVDYASSSAAVEDATSGLGTVMLTNSLKVIAIALSVWALFWAVGKLRKHTK